MIDDPLKDLIYIEKASEISGLSSDNLRHLMEQGSIRGENIGRGWVTTKYELDKYLLTNH